MCPSLLVPCLVRLLFPLPSPWCPSAAVLQTIKSAMGLTYTTWASSNPCRLLDDPAKTGEWERVSCTSQGRIATINLDSAALVRKSFPSDITKLTAITGLWMPWNFLDGSLKNYLEDFSALTNLKALGMQYMFFSGSFPSVLMSLPSLTNLALRYNYLTGTLPAGITKIGSLDLTQNYFVGSLPSGTWTSYSVTRNCLASAGNCQNNGQRSACGICGTTDGTGTLCGLGQTCLPDADAKIGAKQNNYGSEVALACVNKIINMTASDGQWLLPSLPNPAAMQNIKTALGVTLTTWTATAPCRLTKAPVAIAGEWTGVFCTEAGKVSDIGAAANYLMGSVPALATGLRTVDVRFNFLTDLPAVTYSWCGGNGNCLLTPSKCASDGSPQRAAADCAFCGSTNGVPPLCWGAGGVCTVDAAAAVAAGTVSSKTQAPLSRACVGGSVVGMKDSTAMLGLKASLGVTFTTWAASVPCQLKGQTTTVTVWNGVLCDSNGTVCNGVAAFPLCSPALLASRSSLQSNLLNYPLDSFTTHLRSLPLLADLRLHYNYLFGDIPSFLVALPKLTGLGAVANYLTGSLPVLASGLRTLDLRNNFLTDLPAVTYSYCGGSNNCLLTPSKCSSSGTTQRAAADCAVCGTTNGVGPYCASTGGTCTLDAAANVDAGTLNSFSQPLLPLACFVPLVLVKETAESTDPVHPHPLHLGATASPPPAHVLLEGRPPTARCLPCCPTPRMPAPAMLALKSSLGVTFTTWDATTPCKQAGSTTTATVWSGVSCDGNGSVVGIAVSSAKLYGSLPTDISTLTALTLLAGRHVSAAGRHVSAAGRHVSAACRHVSAAGRHVSAAGRHVSAAGRHVSAAGQHVSAAGRHVSAAGRHVSAAGRHVSAAGRHVSAAGRHVSAAGRHVSAAGQHVSAAGRHVSAACRHVSAAGRHVSAAGRHVSAAGRHVSAAGRHVSAAGRHVSAAGRHCSCHLTSYKSLCAFAPSPPSPFASGAVYNYFMGSVPALASGLRSIDLRGNFLTDLPAVNYTWCGGANNCLLTPSKCATTGTAQRAAADCAFCGTTNGVGPYCWGAGGVCEVLVPDGAPVNSPSQPVLSRACMGGSLVEMQNTDASRHSLLPFALPYPPGDSCIRPPPPSAVPTSHAGTQVVAGSDVQQLGGLCAVPCALKPCLTRLTPTRCPISPLPLPSPPPVLHCHDSAMLALKSSLGVTFNSWAASVPCLTEDATPSSVPTWTGVRCDFMGNVVNMSLSRQLFQAPLAAFTSNLLTLTSLQHLQLQSNWLFGPVPSTLVNLPTLFMLDLSYNYLTGSFPASNSLSDLDIRSNFIYAMGSMSLDTCTAQYNCFPTTSVCATTDVTQRPAADCAICGSTNGQPPFCGGTGTCSVDSAAAAALGTPNLPNSPNLAMACSGIPIDAADGERMQQPRTEIRPHSQAPPTHRHPALTCSCLLPPVVLLALKSSLGVTLSNWNAAAPCTLEGQTLLPAQWGGVRCTAAGKVLSMREWVGCCMEEGVGGVLHGGGSGWGVAWRREWVGCSMQEGEGACATWVLELLLPLPKPPFAHFLPLIYLPPHFISPGWPARPELARTGLSRVSAAAMRPSRMLQHLNALTRQQLQGSIHPDISKLTTLTYLELGYNLFQGRLDLFAAPLKPLTTLKALFFHYNYFAGSIPSVFSTLPQLTSLGLFSNYLTGTVPIPSKALLALDVGFNFLSGTFPKLPLMFCAGDNNCFLNSTACRTYGIVQRPAGACAICGTAAGQGDLCFGGSCAPSAAAAVSAGTVNSPNQPILPMACADNPAAPMDIGSAVALLNVKAALGVTFTSWAAASPCAIANSSTTIGGTWTGVLCSSTGNVLSVNLSSSAIAGTMHADITKLTTLTYLSVPVPSTPLVRCSFQCPLRALSYPHLCLLACDCKLSPSLLSFLPPHLAHLLHLRLPLPPQLCLLPISAAPPAPLAPHAFHPAASPDCPCSDLSKNLLRGSLASFVSFFPGSKALLQLRLNNNWFSGSLPQTLMNLPALTLLDVHANALTGSLPAISSTLAALFLHDNFLAGTFTAAALTACDASLNCMTSAAACGASSTTQRAAAACAICDSAAAQGLLCWGGMCLPNVTDTAAHPDGLAPPPMYCSGASLPALLPALWENRLLLPTPQCPPCPCLPPFSLRSAFCWFALSFTSPLIPMPPNASECLVQELLWPTSAALMVRVLRLTLPCCLCLKVFALHTHAKLAMCSRVMDAPPCIISPPPTPSEALGALKSAMGVTFTTWAPTTYCTVAPAPQIAGTWNGVLCNPTGQVVSLQLANSKLTGTLPLAVSMLSFLTSIAVSPIRPLCCPYHSPQLLRLVPLLCTLRPLRFPILFLRCDHISITLVNPWALARALASPPHCAMGSTVGYNYLTGALPNVTSPLSVVDVQFNFLGGTFPALTLSRCAARMNCFLDASKCNYPNRASELPRAPAACAICNTTNAQGRLCNGGLCTVNATDLVALGAPNSAASPTLPLICVGAAFVAMDAVQAGAMLNLKASLGVTFTDWKADSPCSLPGGVAAGSWSGVTCDGSGKVLGIVLSSQKLAGSIHSDISKLNTLTSLDLQSNLLQGRLDSFTAGIKTPLVLKELALQFNYLVGPFPSTLLALTTLSKLSVAYNYLTGTVPVVPASAKSLDVQSNFLSGAFPTNALTYCAAATNCLTNANNCAALGIAQCTATDLSAAVSLLPCTPPPLVLSLPPFLPSLPTVSYSRHHHYAPSAHFVRAAATLLAMKTVPGVTATDWAATTLVLQPKALKSGSVPMATTVGSCTVEGQVPAPGAWTSVFCNSAGAIVALLLPNQKLAGSLSSDITKLTALTALDLSANLFQQRFDVFVSLFTSLKTLKSLSLQYNWFYSSIPAALLALPALSSVPLSPHLPCFTTFALPSRDTPLTCPTPPSSLPPLAAHSKLNRNYLTGVVPTVGAAAKELNVAGNFLSGSFPTTGVTACDARSNCFTDASKCANTNGTAQRAAADCNVCGSTGAVGVLCGGGYCLPNAATPAAAGTPNTEGQAVLPLFCQGGPIEATMRVAMLNLKASLGVTLTDWVDTAPCNIAGQTVVPGAWSNVVCDSAGKVTSIAPAFSCLTLSPPPAGDMLWHLGLPSPPLLHSCTTCPPSLPLPCHPSLPACSILTSNQLQGRLAFFTSAFKGLSALKILSVASARHLPSVDHVVPFSFDPSALCCSSCSCTLT
ncbi:unnamed protein product, partial [Closterium sp. Naga37s-1]